MKFKGVDYYNIDELLSDEEKMTRSLIREFLEKEVEPLITEAFHQEKPLNVGELALRTRELGMTGAFIPEEYGCAGTNYVSFGLMHQESERVDSAVIGANGISLDYSLIRHMANIESIYTYQRTDDIHTLVLGQDITGIPAFKRTL